MLPSVTKPKYVRDYLIEVKFNDGTKKIIDFEPWLAGPIFRPLKSKVYFRKFFIDGPTIPNVPSRVSAGQLGGNDDASKNLLQ